jgi:glycolate oxidase subunit GlcD
VSDLLAALAAAVGPALVQTDPDVIAASSRDQAAFAAAGKALALVRARTVEDVIATLKFAHEHRVPVVTRGAGTGLAGGANASDGCILLSVMGLDRIHHVDPLTMTAVVEPGVLNATLAAAATAQGLYYAPDPSSRDISSIGGNIATNAGGACCLKYGVTGDHVAALKAVLADGTLINTGSLVQKNVAGLDLTRLLVGSEGTLAVIVEATVRLLRAPAPPSTLVAFFDTVEQAVAAIAAMELTAELSLIEVMDRTTLGAVEAMTNMQLNTSAAAMVLAQSDASDAGSVIERCQAVCRAHEAREVYGSSDPEEGRALLAARRLALPALEKLGATLLDDVCVPKVRLAEMFALCERAATQHGVTIGTFGHAGDGNLHPTIVFDAAKPASVQAARDAFDDLVRGALKLGGSITGEHGVGTLKRDYLRAMVGEAERALMGRIKAAFDPRGILNPGKAL